MICTKRDNYFRCQYQKGEVCESVVVSHKEPICAPEILVALCELAIKVKDNVDSETGKRVALEVLKIHEYFIKTVESLKIGTGASKSYYLNKKSKDKTDRTERIDLEFYGEYGIDKESHPISKYIKLYRDMKDWHN